MKTHEHETHSHSHHAAPEACHDAACHGHDHGDGCCCGHVADNHFAEEPSFWEEHRTDVIRIAVGAILLLSAAFGGFAARTQVALFLASWLVVGGLVVVEAVGGLFRGRFFDENVLMSIASVGALILGEYAEGIAVLLFFHVGELFEEYAVARSRKSIRSLVEMRPDTAVVVRNGREERVAAESVDIGEVAIVAPGERIPLDGEILIGESTLDTSSLTGESKPATVGPGKTVSSGCVNLTGMLRIRVVRSFSDSAASRILKLVEDASSRKAGAETFISRFARVYTPVVCLAALLVAVGAPLVQAAVTGTAAWGVWSYRALAFLVVSCPCALVISVPLCFFCSVGGASRRGILVKGSQVFERLAHLKVAAFDKTGTLTRGRFDVTHVQPVPGVEAGHLLEVAAIAEAHSAHPVAVGIVRAYAKKPEPSRVADLQEKAGRGVIASVDGAEVVVGGARLLEECGISLPADAAGKEERGSLVCVAENGRYIGSIVLRDTPKPGVVEALRALRRALGKDGRLVLLSGDRPEEAGAISAEPVTATALAVAFTAAGVEQSAAITVAVPVGVVTAFLSIFMNNIVCTLFGPNFDRMAQGGHERGLPCLLASCQLIGRNAGRGVEEAHVMMLNVYFPHYPVIEGIDLLQGGILESLVARELIREPELSCPESGRPLNVLARRVEVILAMAIAETIGERRQVMPVHGYSLINSLLQQCPVHLLKRADIHHVVSFSYMRNISL